MNFKSKSTFILLALVCAASFCRQTIAEESSASYVQMLGKRIRSNTYFVPPSDWKNNDPAEYEIHLDPDGTITSIRRTRSSGLAAYDEAVVRAIMASEPFPPGKDGKAPEVFILSARPRDELAESPQEQSDPAPSPPEVSDEMRQALQKLADSQHVENIWPMVVSNLTVNGPAMLMAGVTKRSEEDHRLSDEEKEKIKRVIASLSPDISAYITDYFQKIDSQALISKMVMSVYPKYYSIQDVRALTAFYEGPVFEKVVRLKFEADMESKRTGEDANAILNSYESRFTAQEKAAMTDFYNSAIGKKQSKIGARVNADCKKFFDDYFAPLRTQIFEKFGPILKERMGTTNFAY